ncbi:MAG: phage tail spike protein [Ruminococcus bromii]|nr:phage tail spike protein [Ruminococcus bromii]
MVRYSKSRNIRQYNVKQRGRLLELFGGEYDYNNLQIIHKNRLGSVKNFSLRYGSNISDATQIEDATNMYSHILPYADIKDSGKDDAKIPISTINPIEIHNNMCPFQRIFLLDCTEQMTEYSVNPHQGDYINNPYETVRNRLAELAQIYATKEKLGQPNISISVTHRAELDEMKQITLGDTVNVILDNLGTKATARITSTEYDVLNERWNILQVGESKVTIAQVLLNPKKYLNGGFR